MRRPRVVKTQELEVEECAPPSPPEWEILESYDGAKARAERESVRTQKLKLPAPVHAEQAKSSGIFAGVSKWISGFFR